jgi:hypothetical protein
VPSRETGRSDRISFSGMEGNPRLLLLLLFLLLSLSLLLLLNRSSCSSASLLLDEERNLNGLAGRRLVKYDADNVEADAPFSEEGCRSTEEDVESFILIVSVLGVIVEGGDMASVDSLSVLISRSLLRVTIFIVY